MPFLDNSKHIASVWRANARTSFIRELEFRGNFIIGLIRQTLWMATFILVIEIIFQNTHDLAGWSKYEVMIILALSRITESIIGITFSSNIMHLTTKVQDGSLDYILTKPLPTQFATFFSQLSYQEFGNLVNGLLLLVYTATKAPQFFTITSLGLTFLLSLVGITIYYSLLVIVGSFVFRIERLEALWSFNILFSEPLTTPFSVFPEGSRIIITYLIPLAFVVFVPAQALTGRLQTWQLPVAVLIAIIFLTLANLAWQAGLKRYTSASS